MKYIMPEMKMSPRIERLNSLCRGTDGKEFPKEKREQVLLANRQPAVFSYQHKIREDFNPNDLGDAYYFTLDGQKK
jgi:hypothetical protein